MARILVTGATGFIGRALIARLRSDGESVAALVRGAASYDPEVPVLRADLAEEAALPAAAFEDVGAVIHLAGHAHREEPSDDAGRAAVMATNRDGTLRLASAAAQAGVRRFVFVSTAAVHGPGPFETPIMESAPFAPQTIYAVSKAEAEAGLWELSPSHGLEVCVLRPPLVYGPGAPGNFARIVDWASKGRPLPSAAAGSRRSMIGVTNLCDALVTAARHPAAAGCVFFASDAETLSTGEIYKHLCHAFGTTPRFLPVPRLMLRGGLSMLGRGGDAARLLDSFRLDTTAIQEVLRWHPPISADIELSRVARGYPR